MPESYFRHRLATLRGEPTDANPLFRAHPRHSLLSRRLQRPRRPASGNGHAHFRPASIEEITVSGFRQSLANSIAAKENAQSIVEVVTAEDIGKLPDVSIAESLARLPGLAAQRLNGRGQLISVRGLSPDFSTALLNGREQVSVGDNRGIEFDQYPSELLSGVLVYKTPDASLLGQGLAGTSDLRTLRPLEHDEDTVAINARYIQNDKTALNPDGDDTGYRLNATWINRLSENLGLALSYAGLKSPNQGQEFRAWGYPAAANGNRVLGGHDSLSRTSELERNSVMLVVEYDAGDSLSHQLDLYASNFKETDLNRGVEGGGVWARGRLQPGFTVNDGYVTAGRFTNLKYVVRNDVESRDSDLFSLGYNLAMNLSADLEFELDISHSSADRDDETFESYSGTGDSGSANSDSADFRFGAEGITFSNPAVDYSNASALFLTDPLGWGGGAPGGQQVGYLNRPSIEDDLNQIRLSLTRQLSGANNRATQVTFGLHFKTRDKTKDVNEFILDIPGSTRAERITTAPRPASLGNTDLNWLGIGSFAAYDPRQVLADGGYALVRNQHPDVSEKSWEVKEDVITAYVQLDFDAESASGRSVSGNFGLQIVLSDQESNALGANTATRLTTPVSGGQDYVDLLPSLNLNWRLSDSDLLRFGLARTLARPRMDEMRVSQKFTYNSARAGSTDPNLSPWSGSGGNPELDPWLAMGVDISYERYFPDALGYFSAALFAKDLQSYVYTENRPYDFSPLLPIIGGPPPVQTTGFLSIPVNGQGGELKGLELALAVNSELISQNLRGFGVILNYTRTDSAIKADPGAPDIQLPGLSKDVWNATLFYERHGFQARISSRYRSDFLGEIQGFAAGREFRQVDEETLTDVQFSYEVQQGSAAGLTLYLQGNNITDEPFSTFDNNDRRQVINYEEYGATWQAGFSYKF